MFYDIVILGSGPAGFELSLKLKKIGKSVCIVEKDELGGVCLNNGCIPTKALVNASKKYKELSSLKRIGISVENPKFDYLNFKTFQKSVITRLKKGIENAISTNEIPIIKGRGYIKNANLVEVYDDNNQKINELEFEQLVIATGSKPFVPKDWIGFEKIVDPQKFWQIENLAEIQNIAIIGGGVIGVEYASSLADLGWNISIFEKMDKLVLTEEPEISQAILDNLKAKGVKIFLRTEADVKNIEADLIVCAIGRVRDFDNLGLENVERWQADQPSLDLQIAGNIFIAGDIATGPQLAHKAIFDAEKLFEILQGEKVSIDYAKSIPSVIFTSPEVSRAGFTKKYAEEFLKIEIKQVQVNFAEVGKAVAENNVKGFMLINYRSDDLRVVGISICGNNVAEINASAQLIVQNNMTMKDLDNIVFSHPTVSEIFKIGVSKL